MTKLFIFLFMFVNPIIYNSAPTDCDVEKVNTTFSVLDKLSIGYEYLKHDEAMTISDCEQIDNIFGTAICKNLFLVNSAKTEYYLLLLPGDKSFKTKDVSKQIGSTRLSFGSYEKMEELLNLTPGSVSITGLIFDIESKVKLLIDSDLLKNEYIVFHPSLNKYSVKANTIEVIEKLCKYTNHSPTFINL